MEKTKTKRSDSDTISLDDFCLDRLFDPEQLYYTPMEELIKQYAKRNLRTSRMYNLAKKYGYVPKTRIRLINAPQMERANIRILGNENFYHPPPKFQLTTELNENFANYSIGNKSEESSDSDEEVKELSYEEKLEQRKTLRKGLNSFDLNVDYLKRKKNLSEIEQRILRKMMFTEIGIQTDPIVEKNPKRNKSADKPKINYPIPILMEKIEEFLEQNKWRLIDLFKELDKDKDWLILKSDLTRQVLKGRLNANESMIDELVVALGSTKSYSLDYKALLSGRISHLLNKRREDLIENEDDFIQRNRSSSKISKRKSNASILSDNKNMSNKSFDLSLDGRIISDTRASSSKSSITSQYLQLPKIETRSTFYPTVDKEVNSLSNYKTLIATKEKFNPQKKEQINEIKSKMNDMRNRTADDLEYCLQQTELTSVVDVRKLQRALGLPREKNHKEIMTHLKQRNKFKMKKII